MAFPRKLSGLCAPSLVYFVLSMIAIGVMVLQNIGNSRNYNFANMSFLVPNTTLVFIMKVIGVLFWTWVLNLICKDGHKGIAWFLVLFPFIMVLGIVSLIMMNR